MLSFIALQKQYQYFEYLQEEILGCDQRGYPLSFLWKENRQNQGTGLGK